MKKLLLFLAVMLAGMQTAFAQKMTVNLVGGESVEYDLTTVESVTFSEKETPIIESHDFVDLGLPSGTLWATCNLGAEVPEQPGDFYAWGETETKETYNWASYAHCNGSSTSFTKYCTDAYYGTVDGKSKIEPADDVATGKWGEGWYIPTQEQFAELVNTDYTTWQRTTQGGVSGLKVTSKANGNSVFLPMGGGYRASSSSYSTDYGYYWTSNLYSGIDNLARCLSIESSSISTGDSKSRFCGLNIRPVRNKFEAVDLGLPSGTLWATCNVGAYTPEQYGDYFAWGETEPKEEYNWGTYKWCMGTYNTLTKYSTLSSYGYNGFTDGLTELLPEDDAATANWGEDWQMPSIDQMFELLQNTTTVWTTLNCVNGLLCTASNGNSIFLPAAGLMSGTTFYNDNSSHGYYWSRMRPSEGSYSEQSYSMTIHSDGITPTRAYARTNGMTIRPVKKQ